MAKIIDVGRSSIELELIFLCLEKEKTVLSVPPVEIPFNEKHDLWIEPESQKVTMSFRIKPVNYNNVSPVNVY